MSRTHTQPLPSKEASLFRQLVEQYEEKRYKKAVKTADQILKKFPEHGESLAMKGLTLSNMGADKKDEAYELVRRGLKADLKSHVCWHVYGLMYRQDQDYKEAIKCYQNALRIDKENVQILRDLAMLQVQIRDLEGFVATRNTLLVLKPNHKNHWIAFALAHHANKNYSVAVEVLQAYEATLTEVAPSEAYEHSELLLYKAMVLDEGGRLEEALTLLDSSKDKICDKVGMQEARASLLLRSGRAAEAEAQYRALLALNSDHYKWHEGLQAALGLRAASGQTLTAEQVSRLSWVYSRLAAAYPASSACRRIPLDFLQGEEFLGAADAYVRKYLRKGIPSLFIDLKPLYSDPAKATALEQLFEGYCASLSTTGCFPPARPPPSLFSPPAPSPPTGNGTPPTDTPTPAASPTAATPSSSSSTEGDGCCPPSAGQQPAMSNGDGDHCSSSEPSPALTTANGSSGDCSSSSSSSKVQANGVCSSSSSSSSSGEGGAESPQVLVWALYYLAQHYDKMGYPSRGLHLLSRALQHTPTLVELYSARSKLLRHAGDLLGAAQSAEVARRADLSDRYLNSLAVKALLRADYVDTAEKTACLFTKDGDIAAGLAALFDMQHMGFECAAGAAHLRRKEYGKALKRLTTAIKHFDDIREDQVDFHSYCIRKSTLRAYVAMLRMEDRLLSHPFYAKAAHLLVSAYLALHEAPSVAQKAADEEALLASMSPEERKKFKLKKKKEEKQRAKEAEEAAAAAAAKAAVVAAAAEKGGAKKQQSAQAEKRDKDQDPDGAQLAASTDALGEAAKLVASLKTHAPSSLNTHLAAAEVYGRRGRLLLALSGVQRALALAGSSHPGVHTALVKLCKRVAEPRHLGAPEQHPSVAALVAQGVAKLLGSASSIASYNDSWLEQHAAASLAHRLAGARALLSLDGPGAAAQAAQLLLDTLFGSSPPLKHEECVEALTLLESMGTVGAAAAQWRAACAAEFEYSRVFGGASCVAIDPDLQVDGVVEVFGKLAF